MTFRRQRSGKSEPPPSSGSMSRLGFMKLQELLLQESEFVVLSGGIEQQSVPESVSPAIRRFRGVAGVFPDGFPVIP